QLFVAGGVEHMTRGPWVISKTSSAFGRDAQMFDSSFGWRFIHPFMKEKYGVEAMGETAENLAEQFAISREDQDQFAIWSQEKASKAEAQGIFSEEITPVQIPVKKGDDLIVVKDEFIKPKTNAESLGKLKPAFRAGGTVTAGNSSGLNDGAAALLIASEKGAIEHGLTPMARVVSTGVYGVEPRIMGIGPVGATNLALSRAGLKIDDLDVIELNEAFAAQVLACTRSLGIDDRDPRLNQHGGAIALGHPLGMSGARLALSASRSLQRSGGKYALVTMCIGVGQGYAMILERA
ncbi:MAG: acetyl-CoA C-acyltransferase, partial [Flavobacteriales bacterium]